MKCQTSSNSDDRQHLDRLSRLARETLTELRRTSTRADRLLLRLRAEERREETARIAETDEEAGWRLAA